MPHIYAVQPLNSHRVGTVASRSNICSIRGVYSVVDVGIVLVVAGDDDVTGGNVRDVSKSHRCDTFLVKIRSVVSIMAHPLLFRKLLERDLAHTPESHLSKMWAK